MRLRSLCGVVFAVVGLIGYAGMTSDLRGSQPVSDSEAARLLGGSETVTYSTGGGCNGTCSQSTGTACSTTNTYKYGPGDPGYVNDKVSCETCGADNACSVVYQDTINE